MQAIVSGLILMFRAHPELAAGLIAQALKLLEAAPSAFVDMLPEGDFKEWAKQNEAQSVAVTKGIVSLLTSDPALLTALIKQFGRR